MAPASNSNDYECSSGGKFRSSRRSTYDRPPTALKNPSRKKKSWFSKLVDPAKRLAHTLFPSFIPKPLPTPNSAEIELEQETSQEDGSNFSYGLTETENVIKKSIFTRSETDHLAALIQSRIVEEKSPEVIPGNHPDVASPAELAKALSRHSNVSSAMQNGGRSAIYGMTSTPYATRRAAAHENGGRSAIYGMTRTPYATRHAAAHENGGRSAIYGMTRAPYTTRHAAARENGGRSAIYGMTHIPYARTLKGGGHAIQNDPSSSTQSAMDHGMLSGSSLVVPIEDVSPIELAKAYMRRRHSNVSSGMRYPAREEDSSLLKSENFPYKSPIMSIVPRATRHATAHENGGRSAIYSMARTPYARTLKGGGHAVQNDPSSSTQSAMDHRMLSGSSLGGINSRNLAVDTNMVDTNIGSVGPIRRVQVHHKSISYPTQKKMAFHMSVHEDSLDLDDNANGVVSFSPAEKETRNSTAMIDKISPVSDVITHESPSTLASTNFSKLGEGPKADEKFEVSPISDPNHNAATVATTTVPVTTFDSDKPDFGCFTTVAGSTGSVASTTSSSTMFASTTGASAPQFSFTSAAALTSTQPAFGSPNPAFAFGSAPVNNDHMSMVVDSMDEAFGASTHSPTSPLSSMFGQQPAPVQSSCVFGASTHSGTSPFQFASQLNVAPQNPSSFQATGNLEFNAGGGGFAMGPGGGDKSD